MSNFRVAYPVGNSPGRDHVLWPTISRAEYLDIAYGGDNVDSQWQTGFDYPIQMDLAQIMHMSWRVREWKIAASSYETSIAVFDPPVVDQTDIAERNDTGVTPEFFFRIQRKDKITHVVRDITDERDMFSNWEDWPLRDDFEPPAYTSPRWKTLRNLGVSQGFSNGVDNTDLVAAADPTLITGTYGFTEPYSHPKFGEGGTTLGGKFIIFTMAGYILFDPAEGGKFYPPLNFPFGGLNLHSADVLQTPASTNSIVIFKLLTLSPTTLPPPEDGFAAPIDCGSFTISFGSFGPSPATCRIIRDALPEWPGPGVATLPTGNFNLEMSPTKYWPFATKAGLPVYDEDTGEQLEDPFS